MDTGGSVYLLGNIAMPTYFKVGLSHGCPLARADQLSAASGVPHPFDVICHIRTDDCARDERHLHEFLADYRHSFSREFFRFAPSQMPWVVGLFKHHPRAEAFSLADGWRLTKYLPGGDVDNPWATVDQEGFPAMSPIPPDVVYGLEVVL